MNFFKNLFKKKNKAKIIPIEHALGIFRQAPYKKSSQMTEVSTKEVKKEVNEDDSLNDWYNRMEASQTLIADDDSRSYDEPSTNEAKENTQFEGGSFGGAGAGSDWESQRDSIQNNINDVDEQNGFSSPDINTSSDETNFSGNDD